MLEITWITECETRMLSVEERVQSQTTAINEFINSHENKLEFLEQQMKKIQQTTTPANQITYVYKTIDEINTSSTQKQNDYKSKQWKKPDLEQNLSKFNKYKVAFVAEDYHKNAHGQKNA